MRPLIVLLAASFATSARAQDNASAVLHLCKESNKHISIWNNTATTCIVHVHCDFLDCKGKTGYVRVASNRTSPDGRPSTLHTAITTFEVLHSHDKWKVYLTLPLMQGSDVEYRLDAGTMEDGVLPSELVASAWTYQNGQPAAIDAALRRYSLDKFGDSFRIKTVTVVQGKDNRHQVGAIPKMVLPESGAAFATRSK